MKFVINIAYKKPYKTAFCHCLLMYFLIPEYGNIYSFLCLSAGIQDAPAFFMCMNLFLQFLYPTGSPKPMDRPLHNKAFELLLSRSNFTELATRVWLTASFQEHRIPGQLNCLEAAETYACLRSAHLAKHARGLRATSSTCEFFCRCLLQTAWLTVSMSFSIRKQ